MESIKDHIIHNDHHMVIVNKPAAFPLSDSNAGNGTGFLSVVQSYVKRDLKLVNRIDTPVSGLVVLAKSTSSAGALSRQFEQRQVKKLYLAVTRKTADDKQGSWHDHVKQLNKMNKSVIDSDGKAAETSFQWIESLDHVHLYMLKPTTGRHHQLRLQMAAHIAPIRGDQKYGDKRGNKDRSIDLHAWALLLNHPSTGERLIFEANLPSRPPWSHFEFFNNHEDVQKYF